MRTSVLSAIALFLASALAFGRVQSVLQTLDTVLGVMGPSPAAFVRGFRPEHAAVFAEIGHRWIRGRDLAALIWLLRQMLDAHGSLEAFYAAGLDAERDPANALESFSTRAMALDRKAIYGRARPAHHRDDGEGADLAAALVAFLSRRQNKFDGQQLG